jgi:ArsR family transcriptional regulator
MLISAQPDVPVAPALFGDPLRERIVRALAAEALCTCHLVADTGAAQPTVSYHLRILREAGLVDTEPCGRFTYYRLAPAALDALAEQLTGLAGLARAVAADGIRRPCRG